MRFIFSGETPETPFPSEFFSFSGDDPGPPPLFIPTFLIFGGDPRSPPPPTFSIPTFLIFGGRSTPFLFQLFGFSGGDPPKPPLFRIFYFRGETPRSPPFYSNFLFSGGDPPKPPLSIRIFYFRGETPEAPPFFIRIFDCDGGETLFSEQSISLIYDTTINILFLAIKMKRLLAVMFVNRLDQYVNTFQRQSDVSKNSIPRVLAITIKKMIKNVILLQKHEYRCVIF